MDTFKDHINYAPINRAQEFAMNAQKDCVYGAGEPYEVHNQTVRAVLRRFGFSEALYLHLHVGAELHDVFEDTDRTEKDAHAAGLDPRGIKLASLVTDEEGKNRKERKTKTYPKIASDHEAVILKLSDRIANVEKVGKINMYKMEYPEFKKALFNENGMSPKELRMWKYLDTILL